jgi:site-specific DNA-methyltransferase (adenine-specific)
MARYGVVEPPVLDERTGRLVAGHGRLEAFAEARAVGLDAPEGVRVNAKGEWLVPVIRGWSSRNDAEAEAYLVTSNELTITPGWDEAGLAEMLAEMDRELADIAGFDFDRLLDLLPEQERLSDPDAVPDPPEEPISKLGDVWLLGQHRVLCGDSTVLADVEQLMDGALVDMVWTDPPYGVEYVGKTAEAMTIQNDDAKDTAALLGQVTKSLLVVTKPGAAVYVSAPAGPAGHVFASALLGAGLWRQRLAWVKNSLVLGHSDYHYRHEDIYFGYVPGAGRRGRGGQGWYGDNSQTSVIEFDRPSASRDHPTSKPVNLIAYCIGNSSRPGDLVLDLFGGSGSTLIACEQTRRVAYVCELDPRYVDVTCRRFQEHTGIVPRSERGEEVEFTT